MYCNVNQKKKTLKVFFFFFWKKSLSDSIQKKVENFGVAAKDAHGGGEVKGALNRKTPS